ncbi:MAG: MarR family transcriptional regulator [Saprospiraceae bacterium]|nr:MarR family transcriptional regulator [Saprospiraceae bacterium]
MKIEQEIQQTVFESEYQKVNINLLFTASWLNQKSAKVLKPFHISWQQFNILRILRGMGDKPATIKTLTERMIDKMSNASRLVEKLKQKGFVERRSCPSDRRQVDIMITKEGLLILEKASHAMKEELNNISDNFSEKEAKDLNELLDRMRS